MQIVISDNRWLYLDRLTQDVEDLIDAHFSAKDPNSIYIDSSMQQSWDGVYHRYNRNKQRLSKGYLNELRELCRINDIPIDVEDRRPPTKYPMFQDQDINKNLLPGITLDDHQVEGIRACLNNEIGCMKHHTASGKTEVMCAIVKLLKCPTVIIAEETIVIKQIKERLELRDVVSDVGMFYAGISPTDQMVCVGSLQSIMAPPGKINSKMTEARKKAHNTRIKNAKKYKQLLSQCELVILDEADLAVNKVYRKLIMQYSTARYIYGFTGTLPDPKKEPVQWLNLQELIGSVISQTNRQDLERIGRIIPIKYITFVVGPNRKNDKAAFDIAVSRLITNNPEFHHRVVQIVNGFPNDNFLILVENIALGDALKEIIPESQFIHGTTTKKQRDICVKTFEDGDLRVLIGSKIMSRGLDIHGGIDNIVLCASRRKDSDLEQKMGRAMRVNKRGWSRVIDFMYIGSFYLYRASRARLRHAVEIGYPATVVTPKATLDGKDVIKRGFNLFRYI